MASGFLADDRAVLTIGGADRRKFLQDMVTNDIGPAEGGLVYAALLTPQGKYLFDFFLTERDEAILLDVKADRAAALAQRLTMYRLRADVTISDAGYSVVISDEELPGGHADPRNAALGFRLYTNDPGAAMAGLTPMDRQAWEATRIRLGVPETGVELIPDSTYVLEAGFDRLNGVDFKKGCYVGQEVTARMRHKTELRKGLRAVTIDGDAPPPGTPIAVDGREVGTLYSTAGGRGLAHLRFDRIRDGMQAGDAVIRVEE